MTLLQSYRLLSARRRTAPKATTSDEEALRVLHVMGVLRPSGAEVMLEVAGPFWPRHGVESDILTLADTLGPYAPRLASAGYQLQTLQTRSDTQMLRGFRRIVSSGAYDVVHIHVERANFWLAAVARASRVGVVQACHGTFQFAGALRAERIVQRSLARFAGVRYVAGSPAVEHNERERFWNRTEVIWNWCDLDRFRPTAPSDRAAARRRLGIDSCQFAIATVGSCAPVKNHMALINALALISHDGTDPVYLHAGDHSAGAGADEMDLVRELGIEGRVHFLGFVDNAQSVLDAADAFVVPSQSEGSALAAVEALSCGLPLIVADVPGLREVAELSPFVRCVAPSAAALAGALREAASRDRWQSEDPEAAIRAAKAARLLDPEEGARCYATLYRAVAPARRHGEVTNS